METKINLTAGKVKRFGPPRVDAVVRFWGKVIRQDGDACWLWVGGRFKNGRPCFWLDGKSRLSHRVAYFLEHGSFPSEGLLACHTCNNISCVRPSHVYAGTTLDNMRDRRETGSGFAMCKPPVIFGVNHHNAKLTPEIVRRCRERHRAGVSITQLAKELRVDWSTMKSAIVGETWREA